MWKSPLRLIFGFIEIFTTIGLCIVAFLWIWTNDGGWEPWTVVYAVVTGILELCRRYLLKPNGEDQEPFRNSHLRELQWYRDQIDASKGELQAALDGQRQSLVMVAEAFGRASVIANSNPQSREIQALASKLGEAVSQLRDKLGSHTLSNEDDSRIRMSEGMIFNALGCFDEALQSVTEEDVNTELAMAHGGIDRAVEANRIRADAYYGQRKWEQALAHYRRIFELRPGDPSAAINMGNCLSLLGRWREALQLFMGAVTVLTHVVEREGQVELSNHLAASLSSRGLALSGLGRFPEAMEDQNKALSIRTRLVEQEGRSNLAKDLANNLISRSNLFISFGNPAAAIQDLGKALGILSQLVEGEGQASLSNDFALGLNNRGFAFNGLERFHEAIADLDKAVAIRTRLVEQSGQGYLANDLAGSLSNRGIARDRLGKGLEAMEDFNKAVEIRTRLVEEEGHTELANELAGSLINRSIALDGLSRYAEAIQDLDKAITIRTRLVEQEHRQDLANGLASALYRRAISFQNAGNISESIEDLKMAQPLARDQVLRQTVTTLLSKLTSHSGRADLLY